MEDDIVAAKQNAANVRAENAQQEREDARTEAKNETATAREDATQGIDDYKTKMNEHADNWVAQNGSKYDTDAALQAAWEDAWEQDGAEHIQALGEDLGAYQAAVKNELRVAAEQAGGGPEGEQTAITEKADEINGRGDEGTPNDDILDGIVEDASTAVAAETPEQRAAALETAEAIENYETAKQDLEDIEAEKADALESVRDIPNGGIRQEINDSYSDDIDAAEQAVADAREVVTTALNKELALGIAANVVESATAGVEGLENLDNPKLRAAEMPNAQTYLDQAEQQYQDVVNGTISSPLELEHFTAVETEGPDGQVRLTSDQIDPALQEIFSNHPDITSTHPELGGAIVMQAEGLKIKPELELNLTLLETNSGDHPQWLQDLAKEDEVSAAFIASLWSGPGMSGTDIPVPAGADNDDVRTTEEILAEEDPMTFALLKYGGEAIPDKPAEWGEFETDASVAGHARELAADTLGQMMLTNPAGFQRLQALMAATGDVRADYVQSEVDGLLAGRTPEQVVEDAKNNHADEETPTPEQQALQIIDTNLKAAFTPQQQEQIWNQAGEPYFSTADFEAQAEYIQETSPDDTILPGYWLKEMGKYAPAPAASNLLDATMNTFGGQEIFQREGINGNFSDSLQLVTDRAPHRAEDVAAWALADGQFLALEELRAPQEDGTGATLAQEMMGQYRLSDLPKDSLDYHVTMHEEGMDAASEALAEKLAEEQTEYFNQDAATIVQEMFDDLLDKSGTTYSKQHDFSDLSETERNNLLGQALQLTPDNPNAAPGESRFTMRDADGNLTETGKQITQLAEWIEETGGENALVTFVPAIYASPDGMQTLYLVKVGDDQNNDGKLTGLEDDYLIDASMADEAADGQNVPWKYDDGANEGRTTGYGAYGTGVDTPDLHTDDDLETFQKDNDYNDDGRLYMSARDDMLLKLKNGHADVNLEGIEAAVTTTWENVRRVGDIALGVAGAVAGAALIVGTGGLAAGVVVAAAAAYGLARSVETGAEMAERGQSLNPFNTNAEGAWLGFIDPQAGGVWLGGIASASGLATLRPATLLSSLGRAGRGLNAADDVFLRNAGLSTTGLSRNTATNLFGRNGLQHAAWQARLGQTPAWLANTAKYSGGALVGGQAWSLSHAAANGQLDLTDFSLHSTTWDIGLLGLGIGSMGAGSMAGRNRTPQRETQVDPTEGDETGGMPFGQPGDPPPMRELYEPDADGVFRPTGRMVPVDPDEVVIPMSLGDDGVFQPAGYTTGTGNDGGHVPPVLTGRRPIAALPAATADADPAPVIRTADEGPEIAPATQRPVPVEEPAMVEPDDTLLNTPTVLVRPARKPAPAYIPPATPGPEGRTLVVGGGTAYRQPAPGEVFLDVAPSARPHIISDIRQPGLASETFGTVLFENIPGDVVADSPAAAHKSYQVLMPGGRIRIATGTDYQHGTYEQGRIIDNLEAAGFKDIEVVPTDEPELTEIVARKPVGDDPPYATERPDIDDPDFVPVPEPLPKGTIENLEHHARQGTLNQDHVEMAEYLGNLTDEQFQHYMDIVDRLDGRVSEPTSEPTPTEPPTVRATVLQSQGHTISNRTAEALNALAGRNLTRREWGKALEALKTAYGMPGDFHGRILSDGSFTHPDGTPVANILEYLPPGRRGNESWRLEGTGNEPAIRARLAPNRKAVEIRMALDSLHEAVAPYLPAGVRPASDAVRYLSPDQFAGSNPEPGARAFTQVDSDRNLRNINLRRDERSPTEIFTAVHEGVHYYGDHNFRNLARLYRKNPVNNLDEGAAEYFAWRLTIGRSRRETPGGYAAHVQELQDAGLLAGSDLDSGHIQETLAFERIADKMGIDAAMRAYFAGDEQAINQFRLFAGEETSYPPRRATVEEFSQTWGPEPQPKLSPDYLDFHARQQTLTEDMVLNAEYLGKITPDQVNAYLAIADAIDGIVPAASTVPTPQPGATQSLLPAVQPVSGTVQRIPAAGQPVGQLPRKVVNPYNPNPKTRPGFLARNIAAGTRAATVNDWAAAYNRGLPTSASPLAEELAHLMPWLNRLKNVIGDIHAHPKNYEPRTGDRILGRRSPDDPLLGSLVAVTGNYARVLSGPIPQNCGVGHYTHPSSRALTYNEAFRLDVANAESALGMVESYRQWVGGISAVRYGNGGLRLAAALDRAALENRSSDLSPELQSRLAEVRDHDPILADRLESLAREIPHDALRADLSLTGFNPKNTQESIAYIRDMLLRYPGMFKFLGETTLQKENVTVQLQAEAFDVNSATDRQALRDILEFADEVGIGIVIHSDSGTAAAGPDGRLAPTISNYDKFDGLLKIIEPYAQPGRRVRIVWAHTGIGRYVRPDPTLVPNTRGTINGVDYGASIPRHIDKLETALERAPQLKFDYSWNDTGEAYVTNANLLDGVSKFMIRHPHAGHGGSDTVKPVNEGHYHQSFHTEAPLYASLLRYGQAGEHALWRFQRGNYEESMALSEGNVRTWTDQQLRAQGRHGDADRMHEMLDLLNEGRIPGSIDSRFVERQAPIPGRDGLLNLADQEFRAVVGPLGTHLANVRPYLDPGVQQVPPSSLVPAQPRGRAAQLFSPRRGVSSEPGRRDQPVNFDPATRPEQANTAAGHAGSQHDLQQAQKHFGIRTGLFGGTAVAAGGAAALFPGIGEAAGFARQLVFLRKINYQRFVRLSSELIVEEGQALDRNINIYLDRTIRVGKAIGIEKEDLGNVISETAQLRVDAARILNEPLDPSRGWTEEARFDALMTAVGLYQIRVDRALGVQAMALNKTDPRTRSGRRLNDAVATTATASAGAGIVSTIDMLTQDPGFWEAATQVGMTGAATTAFMLMAKNMMDTNRAGRGNINSELDPKIAGRQEKILAALAASGVAGSGHGLAMAFEANPVLGGLYAAVEGGVAYLGYRAYRIEHTRNQSGGMPSPNTVEQANRNLVLALAAAALLGVPINQ